MANHWTIEVPPPDCWLEACRRVIRGRCESDALERQARALHQLLKLRSPGEAFLRWSQSDDRAARIGSACLVLANPGNVGIALYSSPVAQETSGEALAQTVEAAADDALRSGLSLVQSIPRAGDRDEGQLLEQAGFHLLARLQYMRRDLTRGALDRPEPRPELTVETFGEYSEAELAAVIRATYEDSQDCPGLAELRRIEHILEGHRCTGIFSPDTWWLVRCEGVPAGCVLVNESPSGEAQMVYLGVVPGFRGQGLARWMTTASMQACGKKGLTAMTLAVDRRNHAASRAYRACGLENTDTRQAYIKYD